MDTVSIPLEDGEAFSNCIPMPNSQCSHFFQVLKIIEPLTSLFTVETIQNFVVSYHSFQNQTSKSNGPLPSYFRFFMTLFKKKWSSLLTVKNRTQISGFQMVVRLPFQIRTHLDHSRTGQVQFLDVHCIS
jgi:hypothetical protein